MRGLIKIEWLKVRTNATFWVLAGLHVGIVLLVVLSGKIFIRTLSINGQTLKEMADISSIPIFQFPDIWHNITYVAGFLKFILAIYVIISITNEITYDTLRQNIMNGMSRADFVVSKLALVVLLSAGSAVFVFFSGMVVGFSYTPDPAWHEVIKYSGFIAAYFLQLTAYLVFALFIGLLIKRTGLAMGLLFLYTLIIEPVLALRINSDAIKGLLPMKAINNLIHMPFGKYLLREVQDFVAFSEILVVICYTALFVYLTYLLLQKRDLK
jgi:ABC-type transport system involved in multi-copper enzyme maturation permease subunit